MLTLCGFATLTIYAGNTAEFVASFTAILIAYIPYMLLLICASGLIGIVMTENGFSRYVAVLAALGLLFWIQGNVLVWDYGVLDGSPIDWLDRAWRGVFDLAVWSGVLLVAISAYKRFGRALLFGALATLLIQLVNVAVIVSGESVLTASSVEANIVGKEAINRFSKDSNIVHIVMDGFQSDIFAEILEDTSDHDFPKDLSGFTFYQDNLGVFPFTQLTIPALLSGELYRNEVPIDVFVKDTLRGKTILNTAYDAGYEVDIAAQIPLRNVYSLGKHTNAYGITLAEHVSQADYVMNDSAKLLDLALFRVVPHFGKALVYRDELWVFRGMVRSEAYLQMHYFADLAFLSQLSESMTADRDVPVYKMFHLMLSHRPTVGNEKCEFDGRNPTDRRSVTHQARCGLLGVTSVLRKMKGLGIYDSSLIVLMADHGAWVPVDLENDASAAENTRIAMSVPVLAIKPPNTLHPFRVSRAPTSIIDVPATIADIAEFGASFDGVSVLALPDDEARVRRHFAYPWGTNKQFPAYLLPIQEYEVDGSPFDTTAWRAGDRYLPEGKVAEQGSSGSRATL